MSKLGDKIGNILNKVVCGVLPMEDLLEEKAELEGELKSAQNGEYENTEQAIADITEDLEQVNATLARRQRRTS